jgi:DNA-binding MarR family transcriptional regulator
MSQRDLGAVMDVDPSILVTLLNPLDAGGHVSRQRDAADRRRHIVSLTKRGEAHLVAAARGQRAAEDALFAGLSADQREELRALLLALRDTLDCAQTTAAAASCTERARSGP